MDDEACNGVGLVVRQTPVGRTIEIPDCHCTIYEDVSAVCAMEWVFFVDVELVGNFADDLFKNIFEGDQTFQRTVFVNH